MYMIFYSVIRYGPYPQVPVRFKKKNQVKSPSPESRVPELGSDPPIGSDRDSRRDSEFVKLCFGRSLCIMVIS